MASESLSRVQVTERDEAGRIKGRYIINTDGTIVDRTSHRSGTFLSRRYTRFSSWKDLFYDIFLPSGFPSTVTDDYIQYQIYDSLQAFSSSIAGLLSSRAVLEGLGVGDERASATSAMLLTVVQETTSRLTTIIFAWRYGKALEPEAKFYRFAADLFNDSAIILDSLSPVLPRNLRILSLCCSGALRALCGVCAGSAKATLSLHFAKEGNVGELIAKDASQETVIGLLGMLCGSLLVSHITSRSATWAALLILISLHLATNYLAVRSVAMDTLNRQRASIVFERYLKENRIIGPRQTSKQENIMNRSGALFDEDYHVEHTIFDSFHSFLREARKSYPTNFQDASKELSHPLYQVLTLFSEEKFILYPLRGRWEQTRMAIYFKSKVTGEEQIKAWFLANKLAMGLGSRNFRWESEIRRVIEDTVHEFERDFPEILEKLRTARWNTAVPAISTEHGVSVDMDFPDE